MRILLLTQHFAPEVTAGRFRVQAFAEGLALRGHEVEVLCPVPNHPSGLIQAGYRGHAIVRRRIGGVDVSYLWVVVRPKKTFASRLAFYGSYTLAATVVGSLRRRPDIVIASSPPLFVGLAGALVAARHRAPWIFDLRDIWPRSAVELGELGKPWIIRISERLERWLYARAQLLLTVNEAARRHVADRAGSTPVELLENGTTRAWLRAGALNPKRSALGLPQDAFVWAYAGNLGLAHGLEVAVQAAARLGDEYRLLIIGEGSQREALMALAADLPAGWVEFRDLMQPAEAARHLRASDAALVIWRQGLAISAKLYDCCAVGRPVIAAVPEDARHEISREDIALGVPFGDPAALAAAVRRIQEEPDLRQGLAARARAYAEAHLREDQAGRLALLAESLGEAQPHA